MINKERAIQITEDFIKKSDLFAIEEVNICANEITDKEFAWYVPFEEIDSEYTSAISASNGLIIDKKTGEFMQPGSVLDLEDWMFGFRIGLRGGQYDLKISEVYSMEAALQLVHKLQLHYTTTETINGIIWNVPKKYTMEQLKEKLSQLPSEFKGQNLTYAIDSFRKVINNNLFQFSLEPVKD